MTPTEPTVLVVTCLTDITSDLVIDAINRRGARVVRIDLADILTGDVEFSATLGDTTGWRGTVTPSTRRVEMDEVTAVFPLPGVRSTPIPKHARSSEPRRGTGSVGCCTTFPTPTP